MALRAEEVLAIANQYTDESVEGGGAIKGKNCTIDSIEPISGGQRVTFKWTLDDGTEQTTTMDVMNGQDGKGIKSVAINEESHLIITYTDDTTYDAGQIQVTAAVDSVNGKTGEVTLDASDVGAYSTSEVDTALADKLGYKTTTETNADNVTENGIYIVNTSAMSNLPTTDVSMGYLLEVRRYGAFAGAIVEQIAYRGNPTTESPMYMRRWFANAWTSWVAIAKKDDIATKADKVSGATSGNFAGLDASGNLTDSGKKAGDFASSAIMDGTTIDSFGDVETALGNKQNKTLDTPLTIGGVSQSTVEGTLGALNSSLVKCSRLLTSMGDNGSSVSYHKISIVNSTRSVSNSFFLTTRYGEFWVVGSTFANPTSKSVRARRVQTGANKITGIKFVFSNDGKTLDIYVKLASYCTNLRVVAVDDANAELSATIVTITSSDYDAVTSDGSFDYALSTSDTTSNVTSGSTAPITSGGVYKATGRQLPLIDLGTSYTEELKADISSGKFEKAVVGGYLTINGHVYYLAHPDYWLHTGNPECTTHHMLVVPAGNIGTGKMNDTNITTGAYAGSDMKTGNNSNTALATARAQIIADFGASNILTHRELFANTVTDGITSDWAWVNSDIDLMNEVMVYGCNVWASSPGYETGIDKCQIKLFQERPDLITTRASYWLRSVVSASYFAVARDYGHGGNHAASNVVGVRPAFAII